MRTCTPFLGLVFLVLPFGFAEAPEPDRPSLLVPPWGGSAAPNLAAEITQRDSSGIDSSVVANDQDSLVEHALARLSEWNRYDEEGRVRRKAER